MHHPGWRAAVIASLTVKDMALMKRHECSPA
jgi:hypothetical protein